MAQLITTIYIRMCFILIMPFCIILNPQAYKIRAQVPPGNSRCNPCETTVTSTMCSPRHQVRVDGEVVQARPGESGCSGHLLGVKPAPGWLRSPGTSKAWGEGTWFPRDHSLVN